MIATKKSRYRNITNAGVLVLLCLSLMNCSGGGDGGGGGGGATTASSPASTFVDSPVDGLHFTTPPSNPAGGLTSGGGHFQCQLGDTVTFDLGGRKIGNPQSCSSNIVTVVSVLGATSATAPEVVNLAQLLLTLGGIPTDQNPIQLPASIPGGLPNPLNFSDPNFDTVIQNSLPAGTTLVSTADATIHLQATFKTLSVTIENNGTVTSNPPGINCTGAGTCSYSFVTDMIVTLTAIGNGFTPGWSGGGCSGTGTCKVTMNVATAVTAAFAAAPPPATLTITPAGNGMGTVTCSANDGAFGACAEQYPAGTPLVLHGAANGGSTFTGFSNGTGSIGCAGINDCSVTLNADSTVMAAFTSNVTNFSVTANTATTNGGGGTVQCTANGGAAGPCGNYPVNTAISAIATPNSASNLTGWTATVCSGTGTCNFVLTANTTITANFNLPTLTVQVSGTGSTSSNPTGINNCTTNCSAVFNKGTSVTLTAGTGLTGWSGAGCSGTANCVVTLNNDTTVRANFSPPPPPVITSAGLFTYRNDTMRTGQNLNESVLTPATVNTTTFGFLFSLPVDGQIYAQPLYVAGLKIGGQLHNVVFVATEHDSVYAFDADTPGPPLWQTSFINPAAGITTVPFADQSCADLAPEIGITSTPVIDPNGGTLYVEAKTKENGAYVHRLHALDVTTGAEKIPPVVIQGQVPGTGDGSAGGIVPFNSLRGMQRAALLLSNNVIYIAFASLCDADPYHGWVFAYDAQTLAQVGIFNTTPIGGRGGIWQSGGGPAADANGNVFVMTGNGTFDGPSPGGNNDFGDSFLKLAPRALTQSDFFTPFDQATLEATDADVGSGSPLLLPDQAVGAPHLMVSAGKGGTIYLVDRDNMGGFIANGNDQQIVQSIPGAVGSLFGTPAYFQNTVYFLAVRDVLRAFSLSNGKLGTSPASQSSTAFGYPGATPVISANGASNGIVWALQTDQAGFVGPAVLHAYRADNVAIELYNSNQAPNGRDNPGPAVKFTVPTVINGKVFVGTQTQLAVFGQLP